ncbi:hypothetical protein [Paenibacillus aceris]|uniref:Carboxypeptidase regulatory-like domain-containing protein n=1 Tax=Paenibacillus aceris TaxID=869555 RepID=A0ABS4HV41_9BACL|nr:hypothetical protein [Paenibacillus aceris]MBP1962493.1 hypothetical protein [Paenibacillus aceris]NHW37307.1 hypothetical protein [Paenibacillus aceris]
MKWPIRFITTKLVLVLMLLAFTHNYAEATMASDSAEVNLHVKVSTLLDGYGTQENPISEKSFEPIPNARLIVIDRRGSITATGLTDSKGEWSIRLHTPIDPRFPSKKMGVVTVITVADGFNEFINFDVPVNEHGNGEGKVSVTLRRIRMDARNEPSFDSAAFHRFTVFEMLDDYAKEVGLVRQKQLKGAEGFGEVDMPWSAKLE